MQKQGHHKQFMPCSHELWLDTFMCIMVHGEKRDGYHVPAILVEEGKPRKTGLW